MSLFGDIFSPLTDLIGGIIGGSNQADINKQNIAAQQAINAQNIAEQEKFAQNSIQWKVADAAKAGISPLAALGSQGMSFSNVVAPVAQSSNALGEGISHAGQHLSEALERNSDRQAQIDNLNAKLIQAKIDNTNADTVRQQAEASQLALKAHAPVPPKDQLYQTVYGQAGEPITIINPKFATSFQTPASWPTQAAMALKEPFEMARQAAKYYSDVWSKSTKGLVVPPALKRQLENFNNRDVVGY